MRQNTDLHQDRCFLEDRNMPTNEPAVFFIMDFKKNEVIINCSKNWRNMDIYEKWTSNHSKMKFFNIEGFSFHIIIFPHPEDTRMFSNGTYECNIEKLSLVPDPKKTGDDTYSFYKFTVSGDV